MLFADDLVLIRGGGDLATGVAYRLHHAGFPLIVLELPQPLVVRRTVALATAVFDGAVQVEDLHGRRARDAADAERLARSGVVPVLVAPTLAPLVAQLQTAVSVLVDARIAKRNIDTRREQAPLVIGMGPGFTAGDDCHAVIETMRGHRLGRVLWRGAALPNTGTPGIVAGKGAERVLRAPTAGTVTWQTRIGTQVAAHALLGHVGEAAIRAPFAGVVRGLIAAGTVVEPRMKIGDVDARGDVDACFTLSDKALAMGGAVLSAILTFRNRQKGV